jgi:hypothetical protein
MATATVFAAQARAAGTYTSPSVTYSGGTADCVLTVNDANWTTTTPTSLVVTIEIQESFDAFATFDVVETATLTPPAVGKDGKAGAGFQTQNDGRGSRQVRARMTLNQSWSGGITGTVN